jgi:hypothetical protein
MSTAWTPISSEELQNEIDAGVIQMSPRERALWGILSTSPRKWSLSPWGDQGGGFWVVAIGGSICIYYNDIEDGFNVSTFSRYGIIDDYLCNQDELQWVVRRMIEAIDAGESCSIERHSALD